MPARSQVFRALQPAAGEEAAAALAACLAKCLGSPAPGAVHDAVEVCLTLQVPLFSPPAET